MLLSSATGTAALLLLACAAHAQFKSTVPLVVAPTTVVDHKGHYVDGLTTDDLILYDNNVPQRLQMDWMLFPIDLVVMVETGANSGAVIDKLGGSGILFSALVAADAGETAVLSFGNTVRVHQKFTADPDPVTKALRDLHKGGGQARILDALLSAMRMFEDRPPGRRRIILAIAEKRDRSSEATLPQVMEEAQRRNVAIYWLTYSPFLEPFTARPKMGPDPDKPATADQIMPPCAWCAKDPDVALTPDLGPGGLIYGLGELFRLKQPDLAELFARNTGGRTMGFLKKSGLEDTIRLIGEEVHRQYILTFEPKGGIAGQYHAIRAIVKGRPDLTVKTREGYWVVQ
jgi:VWFA-related protein